MALAPTTNFRNLTGFILFLSGLVLASNHMSAGKGGDKCGNKVCLKDRATCDVQTQKCVCNRPPYGYGDGRINCYKENAVRTEVTNDPKVKTYNNISIDLPIPCRYLWTHTKTYLKNKQRQRVGYCEAEVYAFHQKWRGKFYVRGFDIAIKVTYDNGTVIMASIRKHGKAGNGHYQHWLDATDNMYLPQGPWGDDEIKYYDPDTNLFINCQYDDPNNLAVLNIKKCGIRVQFRPYDCVQRLKQPMIPHAAYEVNCAFQPEFLNQDKVVAIAPASGKNGKTIDDYLLTGLDREETLIYRAITSGARQNGPFPTEQCQIAKTVMDNCKGVKLDRAFDSCMWILKSPRFIRCYDQTKSGALIMELFNRCFDVYCGQADCQMLIDSITDTSCHLLTPPYPVIDAFVRGDKCP